MALAKATSLPGINRRVHDIYVMMEAEIRIMEENETVVDVCLTHFPEKGYGLN
jgi:hypothetical protein